MVIQGVKILIISFNFECLNKGETRNVIFLEQNLTPNAYLTMICRKVTNGHSDTYKIPANIMLRVLSTSDQMAYSEKNLKELVI